MTAMNAIIGITVLLVTIATVIWSNREADKYRAARKATRLSMEVDEKTRHPNPAVGTPSGATSKTASAMEFKDSDALSDYIGAIHLADVSAFRRSDMVKINNSWEQFHKALSASSASQIAHKGANAYLDSILNLAMIGQYPTAAVPNITVDTAHQLSEKEKDHPIKEPLVRTASVTRLNPRVNRVRGAGQRR